MRLRPLIVLNFLLMAVFSWTGAQAAEEAVVSRMQGEAMVIRGQEQLPAAQGTVCRTGDLLKTGGTCTLDVTLNGLAGCRVLPGSTLMLADAKTESMHLRIENGNAILNLKKLPEGSTFRVETPTALAAVRGTQFWGRVDLQKADNPVTTFAVREGSVEIFSKTTGLNLIIKEGQALDIPKDPSVVPSLRPALAEELQAMEQASEIATSA